MPTQQEREIIEAAGYTKEVASGDMVDIDRLCARLPDSGDIDVRAAVLAGKADMERILNLPNDGGDRMSKHDQSIAVGRIELQGMTVPDLAKAYKQSQAACADLVKQLAALKPVKTCKDCAELPRLNSREPCFSCRWNPNLHDNWRCTK